MSFRPSMALGATLPALLCAASAAAAPTISEYSTGLSKNAAPADIVTGPDGNLWFTQNGATDAIGQVTPTGAIASYTTGGAGPPLEIAAGADGKLWFTESGGSAKIGTIDPLTHAVSEYPLPPGAGPFGITAGSEGDLWFTETGSPATIGRIVPSTHAISTFEVPAKSSQPLGITTGTEGDLWFTEYADPGAIGRLDPRTGTFTQFTTGLTTDARPMGITTGPEGNIWFTEATNPGAIGRIDPASGEIKEFSAGLMAGTPLDIASGSDGSLYFTESHANGALGRITPSGAISEYTAGLTPGNLPWGIAPGPDGNIWFVENANPAKVGRLTIAPSVTDEGSEGATGQAATLTASVGANAQPTTFRFEYGTTPAYGSLSPSTPAGNSATPSSVSTTVGSLSPGTTYHFRAVAGNASGTTDGPDRTFATPAPPSPPNESPVTLTNATPGAKGLVTEAGLPPLTGQPVAKPVIGRAAGLQAVSGVVLVKDAAGGFAPVTGTTIVAIGSTIDTTHGVLDLITALPGGHTQAATIWGGTFSVGQSARDSGNTVLTTAIAPLACPKPAKGRASAARSSGAGKRSLWARDNHGQYSTHGANSVATVLGTEWETLETCSGTVTRVRRGKVRVRDLHRHRTVTVTAGHSYLARP